MSEDYEDKIMTAVGLLRDYSREAGSLEAKANLADMRSAQQIDTIAALLEKMGAERVSAPEPDRNGKQQEE